MELFCVVLYVSVSNESTTYQHHNREQYEDSRILGYDAVWIDRNMYRCLGGACVFIFRVVRSGWLEAETSSKTLVFTLYESTRRHISEAWNHHQHRFENVKYGMGYYVNFRHCTQIQTYFQKTAALQRRVKPI